MAVLVSLVFSGCAGQKKTVPPYPEQISSVDRPVQDKPDPFIADMPRQGTPHDQSGPRKDQDDISHQDFLLPVLTLVDDRIVAYENKLSSWEMIASEIEIVGMDEALQQELQQCGTTLQEIFTRYNQLHDELISEGAAQIIGGRTMERLRDVQRRDIGFLETRCQQIIQVGPGRENVLAGTRTRLLKEREQEIAAAKSAGNYQQVVQLYEQVPQEETEQLSSGAVFDYGQALLKTGREEEAAGILQQLLQRMRQQDYLRQEFALMQLVADIHFSLEEYDIAFDRYREIINRYAGLGDTIEWARKQQSVISARERQNPEVKGFAALTHAYLTYTPDRDGYNIVIQAEQFINAFPHSSLLPAVNRILFESRDRADAWFASTIQRIETLRAQQEYQQALQLLDTLPLQDLLPDKREYLKKISDDLTTAQFEQNEIQRLVQESALQESWETGQRHLQARQYDQALEVFSGLLETSYADKARRGIEETMETAAPEKRRKAAELFVRAGNTAERETKISLLFESRQLLQEIITKYPQPDLVEKVRNNLARIDEELNGIDPALLAPPGADNSMENIEGPDKAAGESQFNLREPLISPAADSVPGAAR